MCGIAGWIGPEVGWSAEEVRDGLRQRGPDSSGIWRGRGASLAHTRLAIIDLNAAGAQPVLFEEEASSLSSRPVGEMCGGHRTPLKVLVFNGDIYNYRELREEMEAVGEIFSGRNGNERGD
jgi:asparagine synthase (glutamine-hydrolysing)